MKTMQEVQALIRNLREIYTDVRLLDEATVERIQEGKRTDPCGEDLCYACRHKEHMSRHCAAKQALRTRTEQCRLEFFDPDIAQVIARYYEVDGKPYVLEMIKRTHGTSVLDMEDSEHFISSIPGYATKLYRPHRRIQPALLRRNGEQPDRSGRCGGDGSGRLQDLQ